jgi:acetyl-CoA carboxylase biotin carboxyl carrier protein
LDFDAIRQVLDLVREHDLAEFEIEQEGLRLRVRLDGAPLHAAAVAAPAGAPPPPAEAAAAPSPLAGAPDQEELELAVVKSPIVGTFYRSSEPGAAAFVDVGSTVKKGDVLCIIEAMKLMNEIDSEYDGEIAMVYVENGQPVQYGERLFAIKTR